jgi:hypothetical protein
MPITAQKIPDANNQIPKKFQMDAGGADRTGLGITYWKNCLASGYWRL